MKDLNTEEHQQEILRKREEKQKRVNALNSALYSSPVEGSPSSPPNGVSPALEGDAGDGGVLDTAGDIATQIGGGVFDGLNSMLQLPYDLAGVDLEEPLTVFPRFEPSDNTAAQLARGAANFGVGFIPGLGILKTVNYATKGVKALQGARALAASKPWVGSAAKGMAAGAVADFAAFNGNSGRLTDIVSEAAETNPLLENFVIDALRSDEDDSALEGRLKNMFEGALLGGVADTALFGLGAALKNTKFLQKMKKRGLEEGTPTAVQSELLNASDRLTFVSNDLLNIDRIITFAKGRGGPPTQAEIDAAEFLRLPDESVEDAVTRLRVDSGQPESSLMSTLAEQNPDLAERAKGGLKELENIRRELKLELEDTRRDWMEARTSKRGMQVSDETWEIWDKKMDPYLTEAEQTSIKTFKASGPNEKAAITGAAEGLKKETDLARVARKVRKLPRWDKTNKSWRDDGGSFWEDIKREGRIDNVDVGRLKSALKNEDAVTAAEIANNYDLVFDTFRPRKGQTTEDFLKENLLFNDAKGNVAPGVKSKNAQSTRPSVKTGEKSSLAGERTTGKAQTNKWTEKEGKKFAKRIAENSDVQSLLKLSDGATLESIADFARFMDDKIDLTRAPQIFTGVRQMLFEMRINLVQTAKKIDAGTADDLMQGEFLGMAEMMAEITDAYSGNMSRIAQTLQSAGISPKSGNNDWYFALRDRLDGQDAKDIKKLAAIMASAGDPVAVTRAAKAFSKGGKVWSSIAEGFTNSILSGPMTTVVNALSGITQTIYVPLEAMAGAALRGNITDVRTEFQAFKALVDSSRAMVRMSARSMDVPEKALGTDVLKNTKEAWKQSAGQLDARTYADEVGGAISSQNYEMQEGTWASATVNAFGNMVRTPGRVMMTVDEMAKGLNYNMRLSRNAYQAGLDAKVTDMDGFIRKYMEDAANWSSHQDGKLRHLNRARHDEALDYARRATFQEDLSPASYAKDIQSFTRNHPSMRLVMPFVRTPSNILKFVGQRTPILNRLSKEVQNDLAQQGPKAQAVRDRMNVSTVIWTSAMIAVGEGVITGSGPSDYKERKMWFDTGWQPYSIYTGMDEEGNATWVSYRRGDPLGMFLGLAADLGNAFTNADTQDPAPAELAGAGMYALMENLKSRSYFTGVTQLLNAFDNPERLGPRYLNNILSNVVPNLLSQSRRYGPVGNDDSMREVDGLLQTWQNRLPVASKSLMPKRNLYGEITKYPVGVGPDILNPFYTSKSSLTPDVLKQLKQGVYEWGDEPAEDRPAMAAVQIGYSFDMNRFDNIGQVELTAEQRDRWIQLTGPPLKKALISLVSSDGWKALSDPYPGSESESGKYQAFSEIVQAYKDRARGELMSSDQSLREAERAAQMNKVTTQTYRQDSSLL